MIDNFSLALTHGLMLYAAWKLLFRSDLDSEDTVDESVEQPVKRGWGRR